MSKHTPGPWQIARFKEEKGWCTVETVERGTDLPDQGYDIALVYSMATEPGPNARLIAAAPELLKVLALIADKPWSSLCPDAAAEEMQELARTAIRAATGEGE